MLQQANGTSRSTNGNRLSADQRLGLRPESKRFHHWTMASFLLRHFNRNRYRKLQMMTTVPTKVKSRKPAYSHLLIYLEPTFSNNYRITISFNNETPFT